MAEARHPFDLPSELYEFLERRQDLREIPVQWEMPPETRDDSAERAVRDLSWQPSHEQTRRECDLMLQMLDLTPPARVLDVCCGPGRHVLELARRGFEVAGLDRAPAFVEYTRRAAERRYDSVLTAVGDARDAAFSRSFQAAAIFENTLSIFHRADAVRVLDNIRQALVEGGRFFCDLDNLYTVARRELNSHTWYRTPEGFVLQETFFDVETSVQKCRDLNVNLVQGRFDEYRVCKRIDTLTELDELLSEAGLKRFALAGDWDGSAYQYESPKMIVAAERV
jgi:SAM-dependent methyltransferase